MEEAIKHSTLSVNGINMHVASKGQGALILLLHGFPEFWYSWRHQIVTLASLGYHAVAPDLRGYGNTDAPPGGPASYTTMHVVGDLIALLDAIAPTEKKVFVAGHDWGAIMAWHLCLYRPDRVKALIALSVAFSPRNPKKKPLETLRALYGDDYYICRFQEFGKIEEEIAEFGTEKTLRKFLQYRDPGPLYLPEGKWISNSSPEIPLPPWLSQEELNYYVEKYEKTGFGGPLSFYRAIDLSWELNAPWTGAEVRVPAMFIVGDLDPTYNSPGMKDYIQNGGFKKNVPLLQEVVVMQGIGHFIHEEKSDEVAAHIHHFFSKFV